MVKILKNPVVQVIIFISVLYLAGVLGSMERRIITDKIFIYTFTYVLSIGIYISIFASWIVSVLKRIMQKHVRGYFAIIGANMLLWVSIRGIKWAAFSANAIGDRISWYMYYIPLILMPLSFLFICLCVGTDEKYHPPKRWKLLFIPAILLILLVLTNDMHKLVFNNFNLTIHPYGQHYDYGIGYFMVAVFILTLLIVSLMIVLGRFYRSSSVRRASRMPIAVLGGIVIYVLLYMKNPSYGIGYYFLDATIFGCGATLIFLEACIQAGLLHSNRDHKEFFALSTIKAQILTKQGEVAHTTKDALFITSDSFERLKAKSLIDYDNTTQINMAAIRGGYVAWNSDIGEIKSMISRLDNLNKELNAQVDSLIIENIERKQRTKVKKLSELNNIFAIETLPYSEKIKNNILQNENASLEKMKNLLLETSLISTYLKRKVNMILIAQTEKVILSDEVERAFLESFETFRAHKKHCTINIINNFRLNLNITLLCLDLYQKILEEAQYDFNVIYITLVKKANNILFTIDMERDKLKDFSSLEDFCKSKLAPNLGEFVITEEEESTHFSFSLPA